LDVEELFVAALQPTSTVAAARHTRTSQCRKANFFNLSINEHTNSAAPIRRIAYTELCLGVSSGTTVRKDKIRLGGREQGDTFAYSSGLAGLPFRESQSL
jgi:hypothetical protein